MKSPQFLKCSKHGTEYEKKMGKCLRCRLEGNEVVFREFSSYNNFKWHWAKNKLAD